MTMEIRNLRLDENKPPLSEWSTKTTFYNGSVEIETRYSWSQEIPPFITDTPGFEEPRTYRLTCSFINTATGEIEDEHNHFFASAELLEKIKTDFKKYVLTFWGIARKIDHNFPQRTHADLSNLLDPAKDCQPSYFYKEVYAEIARSRLKSYALEVKLQCFSKKHNSFADVEIFYGESGKVEGLECSIRRRSTYYHLRVRSSTKGLYIKRIESNSKLNAKNEPSFEAASFARYKDKVESLRIA